jgi:hypothetical protein
MTSNKVYLFLGFVMLLVRGGCAQCVDGQYTASGTCLQCSALTPLNTKWSFTPGTGGSAVCVTYTCTGSESCIAGTYSAAGSTTCTKCPMGTYSDTPGAGVCIQCPAGTYSATPGATTCTQCVAGTASNVIAAISIGTCAPCAAGTASSVFGATLCTACLPGYYATAGKSSCTQCTTGQMCVPSNTC